MVTKLCLRASTRFLFPPPSLPFSPPTPRPLPRQHFKPYSSSQPSNSPIKMSTQIVEHIVLFKVKPDTDPSKIDSMVNGLNALNSLDQVLHLTAGPVFRTRSASFSFTHMLHSRYRSKEDLSSYSDHPSHVGVVTESVRPICEDIMAVDWVADCSTDALVPRPGSAMRVTFLKLKEGSGDDEKNEILSVIGGIKVFLPSIIQISFGENFSPARAKGFSIGSVAVFPGLSELEAMDSYSELITSQKDKVRGLLENVIVLDYEIPQQQTASL